MKPASAKAKGKLLESYVADQIRVKGIDLKAYPSHGSGSSPTEKGDIWTSMMILGQNVGIECKNHGNLHIPEWWQQTKKLESLSREPVLVFKIPYESDGDTKCVVYLDTLLCLVKENMDLKNGILSIKTSISAQMGKNEMLDKALLTLQK